MTIGVSIATEGSTPASAATKLGMGSVDTSVDNIDVDASTSASIVGVRVGECGD